MANIDTLVEELGKLTVLEAADLVKKLEETWGVSAAAPVAMVVVLLLPPRPLRRKTEFDVVLTDAGGNKIAVIKRCAKLLRASDSPTPRSSSRAPRPRSSKAPPRTPPRPPRRNWKRPAPRSNSSNIPSYRISPGAECSAPGISAGTAARFSFPNNTNRGFRSDSDASSPRLKTIPPETVRGSGSIRH